MTLTEKVVDYVREKIEPLKEIEKRVDSIREVEKALVLLDSTLEILQRVLACVPSYSQSEMTDAILGLKKEEENSDEP